MKKLIFTIVIATTLGTPKPVLATHIPMPNNNIVSNWWGSGRQNQQTNQTKRNKPPVAGKPVVSNAGGSNMDENWLIKVSASHSDYFLKDTKSLYLNETTSKIFQDNHPVGISKSVEEIEKDEENYTKGKSVDKLRESIEERIKKTAQTDKAVSIQAVRDAGKRFEHLTKTLEQFNQNGKGDAGKLASLQLQIDSELALIQNEIAKLQMVVQLRNAEQALIDQQKRKRNLTILSNKNKNMPTLSPRRVR